jgi:disulfide oxidoreductase YuzD
MGAGARIEWLKEPENHDYPAAQSYLNLLYERAIAKALAQKLRRAPLSVFKAKDIFRASGLSLLGISNNHVEKDRKKIKSGKKLSPLLLVRDKLRGKVIIADGYHRLCAVYSFDEDAEIPCKIV